MQTTPQSSLSQSSALSRSRGVLLGFVAVLTLLILNATLLYRNLETLRLHQRQMRSAAETLDTLEEVLSSMKDAETGQRGYQITGVEVFLEPYHAGKTNAAAKLAALRLQTAGNAQQQQYLDALDARMRDQFAWLERAITGRRSADPAMSSAAFYAEGKQQMDAVREAARALRVEEEDRRRQLQEQVEAGVTTFDRSFAVATLVNLILACISYYLVRRSLQQQARETERQADETWLRTGLGVVNDALLGDFNLQTICQKAAATVASYLEVPLLNLYTSSQHNLHLRSSFGGSEALGAGAAPRLIPYGHGLTGAAAAERRLIQLKAVPGDYFKVLSSSGNATPGYVVIIPLIYQNIVKGVIELGAFTPFTPLHLQLLEGIAGNLGTSIDAAESRSQLQELLEETQRQAEELQSQQEELRVGNEELESQAVALKSTRDNLQVQQEELQQTNEELEQQARALELQKTSLGDKNRELERARREIEQKANELEISGRYKSEFLANMSHELRTPLNSLLILSTLLTENQHGHLDDKEVEFSRTIHRAGSDLLGLINDILDLSKVEAGKLDLHVEAVRVDQLLQKLDATFAPLAAAKGLHFTLQAAPDAPTTIATDAQRTEQILRNFLSNAIKFTSAGAVRLRVSAGHDERGAIAFRVEDTGIGIAAGKLTAIFEAFQQADGSTSREFGGTGLGLTISRELAALLGGSIEVASQPGQGSAFTLYMPAQCPTANAAAGAPPRSHDDLPRIRIAPAAPEPAAPPPSAKPEVATGRISGDTGDIKATDRIILIIEDDEAFAETLVDLAHDSGFKALCVGDGETGMDLLERHVVHAVLLDVKLPDVSGLSILERIKHNPKTRHLPIHMISGSDHARNALQLGAIGYLLKPASLGDLRQSFVRIEQMIAKTVKKVLIVEDDAVQRLAVSQLISGHDIETVAVGSGAEAIAALAAQPFDCMILDLKLPDISGFELLEKIAAQSDLARPPVVIYTGKDLSRAETQRLQHYAESIVIKGARSPERLLDEVSLFLHRVEAEMPQDRQAMLQTLREKEKVFEGKKVLVVDDDMRNVFALANALERRGLKVLVARDGKEALGKLGSDSDISLVLMDIMMPHMDGYEAMRRIRLDLKLKKLPIIALTAKAMRGDQEKCLEAGANDYLPKPVDLERLLSLLRVWLPQGVVV